MGPRDEFVADLFRAEIRIALEEPVYVLPRVLHEERIYRVFHCCVPLLFVLLPCSEYPLL